MLRLLPTLIMLIMFNAHLSRASEYAVVLQYFTFAKTDTLNSFLAPFPKEYFEKLDDCEIRLFELYRSEQNERINTNLDLGTDYHGQPRLFVERKDYTVLGWYCQLQKIRN